MHVAHLFVAHADRHCFFLVCFYKLVAASNHLGFLAALRSQAFAACVCARCKGLWPQASWMATLPVPWLLHRFARHATKPVDCQCNASLPACPPKRVRVSSLQTAKPLTLALLVIPLLITIIRVCLNLIC